MTTGPGTPGMPSRHTNTLQHHALMALAEQAAVAVAPRSREIEALRHLPQDIAEAMAEAGLYRLLTPAAYGGHECHVATYLEVVECVARGDASAAWCMFISCTASVLAAYLPPAAAAKLFAPPALKAAGVFAPRGRAVPERRDGIVGYRVSGRWGWGSGAHNADLISGGCVVTGANGRPEASGDGAPRVLSVLFERSQVHLLDNWHAVGLCGSGSGEFEVVEQFVPADRCASLFDAPTVATPLYRFPVFGLLAMSIAAVATGIARQALDTLVAQAGATQPQASSKTLAQRPAVQQAVARAEAELRSARAFLLGAACAAWDEAEGEGQISLALRRDLRLAATHAVHASAALVDRLFSVAGGGAIFADSPLQRCLRNVHVATQHMMVAEPSFELSGRLLLGLPTDVAML
jgi:alkylation response protein AidB-like acyl-CoA dehydrogenase